MTNILRDTVWDSLVKFIFMAACAFSCQNSFAADKQKPFELFERTARTCGVGNCSSSHPSCCNVGGSFFCCTTVSKCSYETGDCESNFSGVMSTISNAAPNLFIKFENNKFNEQEIMNNLTTPEKTAFFYQQLAVVTSRAASFISGLQTATGKKQQSVTVNGTFWEAKGADPACGMEVAVQGHKAVFPPGSALCTDVCLNIPESTQIVGVELHASNGKDIGPGCKNGEECGVGWSKWWESPQRWGTKVCGHFKNWSHDMNRTATMIIFYK